MGLIRRLSRWSVSGDGCLSPVQLRMGSLPLLHKRPLLEAPQPVGVHLAAEDAPGFGMRLKDEAMA